MAQASVDFRFATAVAAYGQLLRGSPHLRDFGWREVVSMAERSLGRDPHGQRREFMELVQRAAQLARCEDGAPVAISR